jgi:DNA-binding beta-propeller fold protein YncE
MTNLARLVLHGFGLLAASTAAVGQSTISNFAGTGVKGFSGDGGPAIKARLNGPTGVVRAGDGAVYICDTANHRIRKVTRDGKISTFAGNGEAAWTGDGGPAISAGLNEPYEVRIDSKGNVLWVERLSHTVRRCDARSGIVTTIAGNGRPGFAGDGGPAINAQLNEPHSIGLDGNGDLYLCDIRNHRIRKVDLKTGIISTFAGTGERKATPEIAALNGTPLNGPRALDFDKSGNLWLALREGNAVLRLGKDGIHRMGGTGEKGAGGDGGPARNATLSGPKGLSIGAAGDCYLADTENHSIRRIDASDGTIHLVAGIGTRGDGTDSNPLKCALARPHGIFVELDGSIYIGDTDANRVRLIRQNK